MHEVCDLQNIALYTDKCYAAQLLLVMQRRYCWKMHRNLFQHLQFVQNPYLQTITDHLTHLWKSAPPGHSEHVQSGPSESSVYQQTGLWPADWKSKQAQLDLLHVSITSAVCKEEVRRRGLGSAQPVPSCHHFLWVSHHVPPLLHSLWDRAVESQLNLRETLKRRLFPQFVSLNFKTPWNLLCIDMEVTCVQEETSSTFSRNNNPLPSGHHCQIL